MVKTDFKLLEGVSTTFVIMLSSNTSSCSGATDPFIGGELGSGSLA